MINIYAEGHWSSGEPRDGRLLVWQWLALLLAASVACFMVIAYIAVILWLAVSAALARDSGQFSQTDPSIKQWFNALGNKQGGQCCSFADGFSLDDPQWDEQDGHYRVYLDGGWIVVPDDRLVTSPNKIGRAVVWPYAEDGVTKIRCFMPGVEG